MNNNYNNQNDNGNYNKVTFKKEENTGSPILGLLLLLILVAGIVFALKPKEFLKFFKLDKEETSVNVKTFTVTFDANEGTVTPSERNLYKGAEYGRLPVPVRKNFRFIGWYTSRQSGVKVTENTMLIGNTIIYAHWEKGTSSQEPTYTLFFDANEGTVSPSNKSLNKGEEYGDFPIPIRNGYTFDGWFTELYEGEEVNSAEILKEDVTIYAHWSKLEKPVPNPPIDDDGKSTLTLDPNGGEVDTISKQLSDGEEYGELPEPTREGYEFIGWFTKRLGGEQVNEGTIINGDTTIYAHWKSIDGENEETYTLVFDPNGGSVSPTSKTVNVGGTYGELPIPIKSGYTFDGWYSLKDGGTKVDENTIINGNTIIYAHWIEGETEEPTRVIYTVTYNANGGNVNVSQKNLKENEPLGNLPTPIRGGYTFEGWYTEKEGGTKVSSNTIITGNMTIYAHWKKNPTTTPTADSICESVKDNASIDYASFKDLTKQNNDDYYVIKAAHDCANKYHKPVVVTKGTYHIYKYNKEKSADRIVISTDTNFGDSIFYIHDEKDVCSNGSLKYDDYIFDVKDITESYTLSKPQNIKKGGTINIPTEIKTKIENKLKEFNETVKGYHIDIEDQNKNRKIFIRSGENESDNNQSLVQESFKVDTNGKILNDISWKYNDSDNIIVSIRPISSRKMIIKNGVFRNIVASSRCKSSYVKRGMKISRSNIEIDNIDHLYVTKDKETGKYHRSYKINYAYHGFFAFANLSDVNFKNSTVQGMRNDSKSDTKVKDAGYSTYDLHISHATDITLNNVTMADNQMDKLIKAKDNQIWGVMGSSFVKDITYNNCVLNRIDTHRGVYNLTVNNSTIGMHALTQIGFGTMTLNNVTLKHANRLVKLRNDYGSTWNGDIVITGENTIIPDNNDKVYLVSFGAEANHNYGYDLYLPNISLKGNITIKSDTKEFSAYNQKENYFANFKVGGGYKLKNFKTGEKPTIKMSGEVKSNKGTLSKAHYN
ncbi:MAG: InlB B-repeat-containing protein [Bacilli bacterium]|nr:InlB B-repeat-containing protein [Bacilli bacterium]